ncbi:SRPBCC family protein [Streptomyces sp. NPDC001275]
MDFVTGAQIAIALTVQIPRERMWELITAVDRIGEWSPEAMGGTWAHGSLGPSAGARFTARNHFAGGFVSTVTCVVTEAERPRTFAWTVLDDPAGSARPGDMSCERAAGREAPRCFTRSRTALVTPALEWKPTPIRRRWAAVLSRCAET